MEIRFVAPSVSEGFEQRLANLGVSHTAIPPSPELRAEAQEAGLNCSNI
jgi:hypothetical protein